MTGAERPPKRAFALTDRLGLTMSADVEHKLVHLEFGKLVRWAAIDAHGARQMALGLLRAASQIDGKTLHVRTE